MGNLQNLIIFKNGSRNDAICFRIAIPNMILNNIIYVIKPRNILSLPFYKKT